MEEYFINLTFHSVFIYPCERILISPDVTIIAQCDKRVCAWCGTSRLFGVLRENALCTHNIMYVGRYEKSLCSDNDPRCYLREMKLISSDWIALLRRILITNNNHHHYVKTYLLKTTSSAHRLIGELISEELTSQQTSQQSSLA